MSVKHLGQIVKIRRGASPRPIGDPKFFGGKVGWVRISDVSAARKYLRSTTQYVSELGERSSVRLNKGDLILSICATIGRPVILDIPACIHDGFVHLYDLTETDTEYLYYYLQFAEEELKSLGQSGTQVNLNTGLVGKLSVFHPDKTEQTQIAAVLSQVDRAIEQTEALIAKQERIKAGLLHDLLTKGLDEDGNLRSEETHAFQDSPLGRIPVEWEAVAIEDCCEILDSKRIPMNAQEREKIAGQIPYYGANGVQGYIDRYIFDESLILVAEDGGTFDEFATRPIAYKISGKSWVNNHAHVLRAKEGFNQDLLFYSLVHKNILPFIVGGTRTKLNQSELRSILIALPNCKCEQSQIAALLAQTDLQIAKNAANLTKLQHLKAGLMQDLLTGRVSVAPLLAQAGSTQ